MTAPSAAGKGAAPRGTRAPGKVLGAWPSFVLGLGAVWLGVIAYLNPWGSNIHGDGYYTYLWARTIVFDHDLDFENDYATCGDPWGFTHMPHGDLWNQWNPGPAMFWVPILEWDRLTGHTALTEGNARERLACNGAVAERAVRGSTFAGLLTLLLAYLASRRHFAEGPALVGAFVAVFLSPLAYHAAMLLSYGHVASACTSGFVVWLWDRERGHLAGGRRAWIVWPILGAAIGAAMLVRPQNAILSILPLFTWLAAARGWAGQGRWGRFFLLVLLGVIFVACAVLLFSPQLWFWYSTTGELFLVPQSEHYMRWEAPRLSQTLFSSQAGLFTWSPLLYTSVLGLGLMAWRKETRDLGVPLLVLFLVHTYVAACVMDWWGGTAYPGRRFDSVVVPMAMGTAAFGNALFEHASRARARTLRFATAFVFLAGAAWTSGVEAYIATGPADLHTPGRSDRVMGETFSEETEPVWHAIGNPLALPFTIPWSLRYGLPMRAWDVAGAPELFFHHWLTMERSGFDWRFDFVERHADLLTGFAAEPESVGGRRVRVMRGEYARALVPISWPEVGGFDLDVAVPREDTDGVDLWAEFDGEDLGTMHVRPGSSRVRFLTSGFERHEGSCIVRFRVVGGTIGMSSLELRDPEPTPASIQAGENRAALERRRAWREAWRLSHPATP